MTLLTVRILLFCLIPIGIFIMIKVIKLLMKNVNAPIIAETPFTQKEIEFTIPKSGKFAVWQSGPLFTKTPVGLFEIKIISESSSSVIPLYRSVFGPSVSGFKTARMQLYNFEANAGRYTMRLDDAEASGFTKVLSSLIPAQPVDPEKYFIQVRESRPAILVFVYIPLLLVGFFFIVGGFILGLLADQVFANSAFIH
jgi:hypothetical protein